MAEFDARLIQIGDLGDQLKSKQLDTDKLAQNLGQMYGSYQQKEAFDKEQNKQKAIGELYKQNYDPETGKFNYKAITEGALAIDPLYAKQFRDKEAVTDMEEITKQATTKATVSDATYKIAKNASEMLAGVTTPEQWTNVRNVLIKQDPSIEALMPVEYSPMAVAQANRIALGTIEAYNQKNKEGQLNATNYSNEISRQNANTSAASLNETIRNNKVGNQYNYDKLATDSAIQSQNLAIEQQKARAEALAKTGKTDSDILKDRKTQAEIAKLTGESLDKYNELEKTVINAPIRMATLENAINNYETILGNNKYIAKDENGNILKKPYGNKTVVSLNGQTLEVQPESYVIQGDPGDVVGFVKSLIPFTSEAKDNVALSQAMATALGLTIDDMVTKGASIQGLTDSEGKALSSLITGLNTGNLQNISKENLGAALGAYSSALNRQKMAAQMALEVNKENLNRMTVANPELANVINKSREQTNSQNKQTEKPRFTPAQIEAMEQRRKQGLKQ